MKSALILLGLAGMLLTGCSKREADEPARDPGSFFPTPPCVTTQCSDVR